MKQSKFLISQYLVSSFDSSIKAGSYPDILKVAEVIIPLHKGGYQMDLGNY